MPLAPSRRRRWVPITYTSEVSWQQELWRLLPTLLLIGGYVWFTRRQLGGMGGMGEPALATLPPPALPEGHCLCLACPAPLAAPPRCECVLLLWHCSGPDTQCTHSPPRLPLAASRRTGGMGGGGGRGIFNVGKAQVTTVDKNSKHKVTFKDVAGCDEAKVRGRMRCVCGGRRV